MNGLLVLDPSLVLDPLDVEVTSDGQVVEELRISLRTSAGQVEPIIVAPAGEGYRLVVGASRLEACKVEGRPVEAVVKDVPDDVSVHRRIRAEAAVGAGQRMSAGVRKAAVLREAIEQVKAQRKQESGRTHGRGQSAPIGSGATAEPMGDALVSEEELGSDVAPEPIDIPEPLSAAINAGVLAEHEVRQALDMANTRGTTTRDIVDKVVGVDRRQRESFQRLQELAVMGGLSTEQRTFVEGRLQEVEHAPSTATDALRRVEKVLFVKVAPAEGAEDRAAREVLSRVVKLSHTEVFLREDIGRAPLVEALKTGGYPEEVAGIVQALRAAADFLEQAGASAFGVGSAADAA